MFDEELPGKKPAVVKNLEPMSVDELRAYIVDLKAEIARVEADIAKKQAHKSAADFFFKK